MIAKLEFACQRDRDGQEYGRTPPAMLAMADKLNEVIEAVNALGKDGSDLGKEIDNFLAEKSAFAKQCQSMRDFISGPEAQKSPGIRPLHIDDSQVKETPSPTCEHSYLTIANGAHIWEQCEDCGRIINKRRPPVPVQIDTQGLPTGDYLSVPEAEPQEQELDKAFGDGMIWASLFPTEDMTTTEIRAKAHEARLYMQERKRSAAQPGKGV